MQPVTSGAGIAEVNDAFLIDASLDPPLIRTLPRATIPREDASVAVLSSGAGVTFLGATYSNLESATAYAYFLSTQTLSTTDRYSTSGASAALGLPWPLFAIYVTGSCSILLALVLS